jgi:hypothetical protein
MASIKILLKKTFERSDEILKKRRFLRIFSIRQVIAESVYVDDFRLEFCHIDGTATVDLDEPFAGWNSSVTQSPAKFSILLGIF